MLISYEQFPTVSHLLRQFLKKHSVFMFLDESHRIKGGSGVRAQEILALSCFPERKLIMSGTPCPQAIDDLIPQFEFLYPGSRINKYTVSDAFKPIFVRTTKEQLGLPPVNRCIKFVPMDPLQEKLYKFLTSEISRQPLLASTKYRLKELQKKIVKIMKFVSNPTLLTEEIGDAFRKEELDQVLASSGCGPKINYACKRARELAKQGEKVIIWSQFVANVKIISDRLQDFGADYICGEVASGDEDEENRREWKIKQFHENPEKMVLVLNPAAASEAISLHKACHHAIYVDRSFNAAHYLQSEDRIHRLGSTVSPEIEIVMCRGTIDEVVEERLKIKVQAMAELLNDTSLTICALDNTDDTGNTSGEDEGSSISREDVEAIFKHLIEVNNV
jgi:SNF2 family DNA or RNA helicase